MATKHIHEIIAKIKGFGKADKGVKKLSSSMKKFAGGMLGAAAAYKTFAVGLDSIKLAGKLEGIESGFDNMRKKAGFSINTFKKLDNALNGTADKMTIMTQANQAMLLGITDSEDQMADMFDVAQRLALAVGQDAAFGIESLVTGLGRQSKLMLDNLGIMVDTNRAYDDYADELGTTADKLTDQERKQAFVNAAMKEANTLVKGLGKENLTTKQKLDKFTTSIANFKAEIGEALIESGVLEELTKYSTLLIKFAKDTFNLGVEEETLAEKADRLRDSIDAEKDALADSMAVRKALNVVAQNQQGQERSLWEIIRGKNKEVKDVTKTEKQLKEIEESRLIVAALKERTGLTENELRKLTKKEIKETTKWLKLEEGQLASVIAKQKEKEEQDRSNNEVSKETIKTSEQLRKITIGQAKATLQKLTAEKDLTNILKAGTKAGLIDAKTNWAITSTMAATDAASAVIKAIKTGGPFPANLAAGAVTLAQNAPQLATIYANKPKAQTGFEGVIDEPTQFTVGEGGAAEYVSVTPMEGVNNASKGQGININITGNVMSEQFVEEELAERISEAVRKGVNFGIV